jgi:spore coat-associated protein N
MSRINVLISKPSRTLGALALLLAAAALAIGSGADFLSSSANPGNAYATGNLSMSNSNSAAAILTASNMKPGSFTTGTVDITNTGSVGGAFSVSETTDSDSGALLTPTPHPLAHELNLIVQDCGAFTTTTTTNDTPPTCPADTDTTTGSVYNGVLDGLSSQSLSTYAANEEHRYKFTVTLPGNADNTFSGLNTSVTFNWSAHS